MANHLQLFFSWETYEKKDCCLQIHETEINDENRSDTDFTIKNA